MSTAVARRTSTKVSRPLKILIPLIQQDIESGDRAGMDYYADAGDKLIEAKPQVAYGYWGAWLSKNFHRSQDTARLYMRYARNRSEQQNTNAVPEVHRSLRDFAGVTERERRQQTRDEPFRTVLQGVDTDFYAQEKQTRDDEVRLHRELALELVDLGYKALATRLHPDRGGSDKAMARLNRVRREFKGLAETRRFV